MRKDGARPRARGGAKGFCCSDPWARTTRRQLRLRKRETVPLRAAKHRRSNAVSDSRRTIEAAASAAWWRAASLTEEGERAACC